MTKTTYVDLKHLNRLLLVCRMSILFLLSWLRYLQLVNVCLLLGFIECMRCGLFQLMISGICQSMSYLAKCCFTVQIQLNGSRSCLGWRFLGTRGTGTLHYMGVAHRFDLAVVKLLWPLVTIVTNQF